MNKKEIAGLVAGGLLLMGLVFVGLTYGHDEESSLTDTLKHCWMEEGTEVCRTYIPEDICSEISIPIGDPWYTENNPTPTPVPQQEVDRPTPRPACPAKDVDGDGIPEQGYITPEGYCYWPHN